MKTIIYHFSLILLIFGVVGCASTNNSQTSPRQERHSVFEVLNQVQIGMSQSQVRNLIGSPLGTKTGRDSEGTTDRWVYDDTAIVRNINGAGSSMRYSIFKGLSGEQTKYYFLDFQNGILKRTEGF